MSSTYLAVVAALSLSTLGPRVEFAGCGVAARVLAFLRDRQKDAKYYDPLSFV